MVKRIMSAVLAIVIAAVGFSAFAAEYAGELSAEAAIVIEAESGRVVFAKNAEMPRGMASTTKMMTALVVLERYGLDEVVTIRSEWTGIEGSSFALKAGERVTIRDLLYGLMLPSGNDAATALAGYVTGSDERFAGLMNAKAAELGCTSTNFTNPHGLDAPDHFSTAHDLARIAAAAMKNKDFQAIVSTTEASVAGRRLRNHNKLLWDYEGTLGVKTGYTIATGRSLVSCAERNGVRFVCVTLTAPDDWVDHMNLYDWAFENYERVTLDRGQQISVRVPVLAGVHTSASVMTAGRASFVRAKGEQYTLKLDLPQFAYAPVVRGGLAGEARVLLGDQVMARVPVFYSQTVRLRESERLTNWEEIKRLWYRANEYGAYSRLGYF